MDSMILALKDLMLVIKDLPQFALWILGGFLAYKLFVVGSIYGVIRLAINKLHDYLIQPKEIRVKYDLDRICIFNEGVSQKLIYIIENLKGDGAYIHQYHVNWLEDAIAAKIKIDGHPSIIKNMKREVSP